MNVSDISVVEQVIAIEYGVIHRRQDVDVTDIGSVHLPEYILDLYSSPEQETEVDGKMVKVNMADRVSASAMLALCDSPRAEEILAKWASEATAAWKLRAERFLEVWRIRNALRAKKMEFFQDLVAGRMTADDLLLPQPSWVWKDGEYVQGE
jgi:hypothetical protein